MFARYGPPALVAVLLAATCVAFAVTERLKLEPSPIYRTRVSKHFSPVCDCNSGQAWIWFALRHGDRITVSIVGDDEKTVRQLVGGKDEPAGRLRLVWRGRDAAGRIAADGNYRIRVHLANQRRTILLPNVIRLDTTPPRILAFKVSSHTVSPDGDHRGDTVHISYRVSEPASIILLVDGKPSVRTRLRTGKSGKFDWGGLVGHRHRRGWRKLTLRAVDVVGNESGPTAPIAVLVRILRLRPTHIRVAARAAFTVRISTDRELVRWKFAGHGGPARHSSLTLRAPSAPGRYRLVVSSGPYSARTLVVVR